MTNNPAPPSPGTRYLPFVAGLFVASLLISNVAAQKLFAFGPFTFTAGIILFPVAYIFGDVLTEVYGYARARQVIWAGFFGNILLGLTIWAAIALPPAEGWPFQEQFASVLGFVPRIVLASILGYWVGEFANSYTMARMKVRSGGRMLWLRTISSTAVGQALDTAVFATVAFVGVLPPSLIVASAISGYVFKVVYEALATPLTYAAVGFLKRAEKIDVYDTDTNFNPFRLTAESTPGAP